LVVGSDAYEYLRRAIVSGELLPGERLLEEELSARLGVGRAAVRTRSSVSSTMDWSCASAIAAQL
jgi:Bacterial regulatory proteins, gntR family